MNRTTADRLRQSLTKAIEEWWTNGEFDRTRLPTITGDAIHEIMAAAAVAVLEGVADAEDYARESGMLKEEE